MASPVKCAWCNESGEDLVRAEETDSVGANRSSEGTGSWAHPHHVAPLLLWRSSGPARTKQFLRLFLAAVGILVIGTPLALVSGVQASMAVAAAGIVAAGMVLLLQPIPTPQTVAQFGISKALLMVRMAGAFLLLSVLPLVYFAVTYPR